MEDVNIIRRGTQQNVEKKFGDEKTSLRLISSI